MACPPVTAPEILTYTRDTTAFQSLGGFRQTGYELFTNGNAAQINASRLSSGVFPALGVSPIMGRAFTQHEDEGSVQVARHQLRNVAQPLPGR